MLKLIVKCNSCGSDIDVDLKSETRTFKERTITRLFFPCCTCGKEYTYFFVDEYIRRVQKQMKVIRKKMKKQNDEQLKIYEKKLKRMTQSINIRRKELEKAWEEEENGRR